MSHDALRRPQRTRLFQLLNQAGQAQAVTARIVEGRTEIDAATADKFVRDAVRSLKPGGTPVRHIDGARTARPLEGARRVSQPAV
ncbi:MAG: hypothetical protein AAF307_02340 [Pseudomonadota bacterium]